MQSSILSSSVEELVSDSWSQSHFKSFVFSYICCVVSNDILTNSSLGCNQVSQIDHIFVVETRLSGLTPPPAENHSLTSPDISVFYCLGCFCVWCVWQSWRARIQFLSLSFYFYFLLSFGELEVLKNLVYRKSDTVVGEEWSQWLLHEHMWEHMYPQGRRTRVEHIYTSVLLSHVLQAQIHRGSCIRGLVPSLIVVHPTRLTLTHFCRHSHFSL